MEYKIGEVSKLLNVSKEMIRYYEKKGALKPLRGNDNNYRTFSTMDVFLLMEMIRYQSLDFGIKDISSLLEDNYMNQYAKHLDDLSVQIEKEIFQKSLLSRRVRELADRAKTCKQNMGNYWVKYIEEHQMYFLVDSQHENYEKIGMSESDGRLVFDEAHIPYIESLCVFDQHKEVWWYGLASNYAKQLNIYDENVTKLEGGYCLCTMIDMGEIGEFSEECLSPILDHIHQNHYIINGQPRGMIVGRGYENGKFRRIMEIQIPIQI